MSVSSQRAGVRVTVTAADRTAEISVFLGSSELVRTGNGNLEAELQPGLYKVQARVGFEIQEQTLIVQSGDPAHTVPFPASMFRSPAPLSNTSTYREAHAQAASSESGHVHVDQGADSWIFVFARDWSASIDGRPSHPARGLSLRTLQDELLVDLEEQSKSDLGEYPWSACNTQVNSGVYKLVLELSNGDRLSQLVVAALGWQTQVFAQQRSFGEDSVDRRADLPGAAILLAQRTPGSATPSFQPEDSGLRRVEFARLGFLDHFPELSVSLEQQIKSSQSVDPMFIIYCANLLLRQATPNLPLLKTLVEVLRQRGLAGHPDVVALGIRVGLDGEAPVFDVPTMLRDSWNQVLRTSVTFPELVPLDSLAAAAGEQLWGEEPWLLWRESPSDHGRDRTGPRAAQLREALAEQLCRTLKRLHSLGDTLGTLPDLSAAPGSVIPFLGPEEMEQLVLTLGVPWNRIQELLRSIERKTCVVDSELLASQPTSRQIQRELIEKLLLIKGIQNFQNRTDLLDGIDGAARLDRDNGNAQRDLELICEQLYKLGPLASGERGLLVLVDNAIGLVEGFEMAKQLRGLREQLAKS